MATGQKRRWIALIAATFAILTSSLSAIPAYADSCPNSVPDLYCVGWWSQTPHAGEAPDTSSNTWLQDLNSSVGNQRYIRLLGTNEDHSNLNGVAFYTVPQPENSSVERIVQCADLSPCDGFPPSHQILVRFKDTWSPAGGADHTMVVQDKNWLKQNVWMYKACPPAERPQPPGCSNTLAGIWTARAISITVPASDGLDQCWPTHYTVPSYPAYDLANHGDLGIPAPFTVLRYGETALNAIIHPLVIHIPDTLRDAHFYPLSGNDDASTNGLVPEGALLVLNNSFTYPLGTPADVAEILDALKTYGAVVGNTSTTGFAYIDVEATYAELKPNSEVWSNLSIDTDSLSAATFFDQNSQPNFTFKRRGEIPPQSFPGPTHAQWDSAGRWCESDPGS
jgi:hypothetical protein